MVLATVALASLRPWETDTVDPHLSVSVGTEFVAVAVAPDRSTRPAVAGAVSLARAIPAVKRVPATGKSGFTLAVAQGQPVNTVAALPLAPSAPEPETQTSPEPTPVPAAPTSPQTVVTGDGDSAGGPSTAVVVEPKPGCEGDEYEITIKFATSAIASDEAEVEILIQRVGRDGSESEIELKGRFDEVGDLLDQVASEDDCVDVRVELVAEEGLTGGSSEAPVTTASLEEELGSVLP